METIRMLLLLCMFLFFCAAQVDHDDDHDEEVSEEHGNEWLALGITTVSGFAALLGALCIFCIKREQFSVIPASLSFSSGVTLYLTFMGLIPAAMEQFVVVAGEENEALAHFYTTLCIVGGVLIVVCFEKAMDRFHAHLPGHDISADATPSTGHCTGGLETKPATAAVHEAENLKPVSSASEPAETPPPTPANLRRVSVAVAVGLILHHFPEGIATFVSLVHDFDFGVMVAFALALHDIPSGICIAASTYIATGSKKQVFVLCLIAAVAYPLGGLLGWLIIETASETFVQAFIAVLFGLTAGIMMHIVFVELLPTALICAHAQSAAKSSTEQPKWYRNVFTVSILLLFVGFLVMDVSSIVLSATGGHSH